MDKNKNNIKKIVSKLTEFEWEQFKLGKLYVRCRTEEDAEEFIYNCNLHSIKRAYSDPEDCTCWEYHEDNTVYCVPDGFLWCYHVAWLTQHYPDIPIIEFNSSYDSICTSDNKENNNKTEKEEYMAANNSTNMNFTQAMRTWDRMCNSFADGCSPCPLHKARGNGTCRDWVGEHPDEAVKIFVKWAAEHPEKTFADDFFEKHPNAEKDLNDIPYVCAFKCGYVKECSIDRRCDKCWTQPLEETEE